MAVAFRQVCFGPLAQVSVSAPDGAVIGVIGEDRSGARELLRLAAGLEKPVEGAVEAPRSRRLIGPADPLDFSPVDLLLLDHALAGKDAFERAQAAMDLVRLVRGGTTVLVASHEEPLLRSLADEIWWLDAGRLAAKGDPAEVLEKYRAHIAERVRQWGESRCAPLGPSLRRGDGRAELISIETLDGAGNPSMAWTAANLSRCE